MPPLLSDSPPGICLWAPARAHALSMADVVTMVPSIPGTRAPRRGRDAPTPDALAFMRRTAQIVFQNADSSLNPRTTVGDIVGRPLQRFATLPSHEVPYPHECAARSRSPARAFCRALSAPAERRREAARRHRARSPPIQPSSSATCRFRPSMSRGAARMQGLRARRSLPPPGWRDLRSAGTASSPGEPGAPGGVPSRGLTRLRLRQPRRNGVKRRPSAPRCARSRAGPELPQDYPGLPHN